MTNNQRYENDDKNKKDYGNDNRYRKDSKKASDNGNRNAPDKNYGKEHTGDEEPKNNGEFVAVLGFVLGVVAGLPLVLTSALIPTFAGRAGTWSFFDRHRRIAILALLSIPFIVLDGYIGFHYFSLHHRWHIVGVCLALLWICELPITALFARYLLRKKAIDLVNGKSDPQENSSIRSAMYFAGFDSAARRFKSLGKKLPALGTKKSPVIGLNATLADVRFGLQRFARPDTTRLTQFIDGQYAVLPLNPGSPDHHLVIGATGSGKTTLLSRMALAALASDWRVAVIDFKGAKEEAQLFTSLAKVAGLKKQVVSYPEWPIDMWRGSKEQIAERIIRLVPTTTGDGDFYRQRKVRAINSVIVRSSASSPTTVDELLSRIRNAEAFCDDKEDREALTFKERGRAVGHEIADALSANLECLRKIKPRNNYRGFSWVDPWQLAYVSLNAEEEGDLRLGSAILGDFASWARSSQRNLNNQPMLLIVDEASALQPIAGAPSLVSLCQRARSAGISVVIASQTLTSLGEQGIELLHSGSCRWLGKNSNPEDLILATGTKSVIESAHQESDGRYTGTKTHREQKAFKIDPDFVKMLPTFGWEVASAGKVCRIYAPPLG